MFKYFARVAEISTQDGRLRKRRVTDPPPSTVASPVNRMDEAGEAHQDDQSIMLLRRLRDVVINARGTKIYAHRALLIEDEYFAKMLKSNKKEYKTNDDPEKIKQRIEKIYFGSSAVPVPLAPLPALNGLADKNKCDDLKQQENMKESIVKEDKVDKVVVEPPELKAFPFEKSIAINDFPLNEAMDLDKRLVKHFESVQHSVNNSSHSHHTYLLLDPTVSQHFGSGNSLAVQIFNAFFKFSKLTRDNYYRIAIEQVNVEVFKRFASSIFYVGVCRTDRFHASLYSPAESSSKKNAHIHRLISEGKGPVPLFGFTGLSQSEAQCRVSLMVQALGGHNVTNETMEHKWSSDFHPDQQKRLIMGTYLLLKSFLKFISNGQRQWRPSAISRQEELLNKIMYEHIQESGD